MENSISTSETTQSSNGAAAETHATEGHECIQVGNKQVETETEYSAGQGEWYLGAGHIREGRGLSRCF